MKIKFCPKCNGTKIKDVTENAHDKNFMNFHYGSPRLYRCTKCGFTNTLFPEADEKKIEKPKKEKIVEKK